MVRSPQSKIIGWDRLEEIMDGLRLQGKKIVSTNGCFDVLHWGHLSYLHQARHLGDLLVVGINSDPSVKELKGPDRPVHNEKTRALQLASLESVDWVTIFSETTPVEFLARVKPAIHVKGGDYTPDKLPERPLVESHGGKIVILPFVPGFSTTGILESL